MEDTWIAGIIPINMWNVYQATGPHTNNHLESWHNRLNKIVGKPHPNLFELVHTFQQEEASTHMTILQQEDGAALMCGDRQKDWDDDAEAQRLHN